MTNTFIICVSRHKALICHSLTVGHHPYYIRMYLKLHSRIHGYVFWFHIHTCVLTGDRALGNLQDLRGHWRTENMTKNISTHHSCYFNFQSLVIKPVAGIILAKQHLFAGESFLPFKFVTKASAPPADWIATCNSIP